jgi:hypothetical protein
VGMNLVESIHLVNSLEYSILNIFLSECKDERDFPLYSYCTAENSRYAGPTISKIYEHKLPGKTKIPKLPIPMFNSHYFIDYLSKLLVIEEGKVLD